MSNATRDPSEIDRYHFGRLRDEIGYEANLIVQRTSWFVTAQAFFFGGLATGLDRTDGVRFALTNSVYFPLIPWLAIAVSALTLVSVLAAIASAQRSRSALLNLISQLDGFDDFVGRSRTWIRIAGMATSIALPLIFILAWGWMLATSGP
jgi:hypothetical protein